MMTFRDHCSMHSEVSFNVIEDMPIIKHDDLWDSVTTTNAHYFLLETTSLNY